MEETQKKAWQKPENWFAWGGLAVLGYLGLKSLDYILPLLERVLENVIYTAALAGVVGILGWIIVSKDFHRLAWYGYKTVMRWLTQMVIDIDPISILRGYVEKLHEKYNEITKALSSLRAQARELDSLIKTKSEAYDHSMKMAAQARSQSAQQGMKTEVLIQTRKAGRLEKTALTYQGLLNKIKAHIALMEKIQEASKYMIADIEDTVDEETQKRKTIRASYKAMAASKAILQADKDREMYDMALGSVQADYYAKLGEIDQFMEDSKDFINSMDLANGVADVDAMAKLDEWDKRANSLLEGGSGKTKFRIGGSSTLNQEDELDVQDATTKRPQSFASMFDKLD